MRILVRCPNCGRTFSPDELAVGMRCTKCGEATVTLADTALREEIERMELDDKTAIEMPAKAGWLKRHGLVVFASLFLAVAVLVLLQVVVWKARQARRQKVIDAIRNEQPIEEFLQDARAAAEAKYKKVSASQLCSDFFKDGLKAELHYFGEEYWLVTGVIERVDFNPFLGGTFLTMRGASRHNVARKADDYMGCTCFLGKSDMTRSYKGKTALVYFLRDGEESLSVHEIGDTITVRGVIGPGWAYFGGLGVRECLVWSHGKRIDPAKK